MDPINPGGVASWLEDLASQHLLTKKSEKVVRTLGSHPRLASYGSVREIADLADVGVSTITRAAQQLGFAGWPQLQEEFRTVYIGSLSADEIIEHRNHGLERPAYAWLSRDRDNLNSFIRSVDLTQIVNVAQAIAQSRRTFVVGIGSYNGIGQILAHSASLYGYDVRLLTEEGRLTSSISQLEPDDLVITINFWRVYRITSAVVEACRDKRIPLVMIGENLTRRIEEQCLEAIKVPSEAVGFSPSLTVVLSVVHAIIAELQAIDPERTSRMLQLAEREWSRFSFGPGQ